MNRVTIPNYAKTGGSTTRTLPIDPMIVDWVELGCRGWDITETGAGIIEPHPLDGPYYVHLDLETLDLIFIGDGAFLRRVYFDLVAAGVHGLKDHWEILYPNTITGTTWVTL